MSKTEGWNPEGWEFEESEGFNASQDSFAGDWLKQVWIKQNEINRKLLDRERENSRKRKASKLTDWAIIGACGSVMLSAGYIALNLDKIGSGREITITSQGLTKADLAQLIPQQSPVPIIQKDDKQTSALLARIDSMQSELKSIKTASRQIKKPRLKAKKKAPVLNPSSNKPFTPPIDSTCDHKAGFYRVNKDWCCTTASKAKGWCMQMKTDNPIYQPNKDTK